MNGTRVADAQPSDSGYALLRPGEYQKLPDGSWRGCTPNNEACNLAAHKVTEHEDGTITVAPSILIRLLPGDGSAPVELWHGWLERGVWRKC